MKTNQWQFQCCYKALMDYNGKGFGMIVCVICWMWIALVFVVPISVFLLRLSLISVPYFHSTDFFIFFGRI